MSLPLYGKCLKHGKYFLINMIGKGSIADVWFSYNVPSKKFVAIKLSYNQDQETADREVEIHKKLEGSPVCIMKDYFQDTLEDGSIIVCQVLPLYAGTLTDLWHHTPFTQTTLKNIYKQIKNQLKILHKKYGLIHGDLKPDNIAFHGPHPRVNHIVEKWNQLGGLDAFLSSSGDNIEEAAQSIVQSVLEESDKNIADFDDEDDFSIVESELDTEDESDYDDETDEEDTDDDDQSSSNSSYDGDDDDTRGGSYATDSEESDDDHKRSRTLYAHIDNDTLENLKVDIIDFSHTHTPSEDLEYLPTRGYRCSKTIRGEKVGFYKDIFALACTMAELEHGRTIFDPDGRTREEMDVENLDLLKKHSHLLRKWLP